MNIVIKVASGIEKGSVIFSDETKDSANDVVRQTGWDLKRFNKNPVMLYGHDFRAFPIGRWDNVRVEKGRLMGEPVFASDENPEAAIAEKLFKANFLKGVSVSFKPLEWKELEDGGVEYLKQELYENSFVSVPANPNALAKAVSKGIITSDEATIFETKEKGERESLEDQVANLQGEVGTIIARMEEKVKILASLKDIIDTFKGELDALTTKVEDLQDKGIGQNPPADETISLVDEPNPEEPTINIDPDEVKAGLQEATKKAVQEATKKTIAKIQGKVED